ncbi:MAG: YfhO family protein [Chloroflexi bacterium]|nr:YfhO family protein [Chloroflexota bacterium]
MAFTSFATRLARHHTPRATLCTLLPIGVILAAWLLFFWRILTPVASDRLTFQQGDFTLQFLAYRQMAYRQLNLGQFPIFEECLYSGYPFQADPQSQVLYPPVLGTMVLGRLLGWSTYPLRALEWEVMLHVLIAALTMYAFLRSARLHRLACVFGALAYAFSGFVTGYAMLQTAILETAAWLPLILLALRQLAASNTFRQCVRPAILLAVSVAMAYTAGHPQTLLFVVYAGAAAFGFWAWRTQRSVKQVVVRGGLAALLAIGLSAAQLLPSLSFMLASTRAQLPFNEAGTGFVLHDISLLVLTGVTNVWQPLYAGMVTLVLVAVALASRRAEVWLWISVSIGALVLGFGANALGFDLAYLFAPGYKQFHSQERHALIIVFALSTLSSIGLHTLLSPMRPRVRYRLWRASKHVAGWAVAAFAVLISLLLFARLSNPAHPEIGTHSDRVAMIALGLLGTAGLLAWRSRLGHTPRWLWATSLLALLVFDLFSINRYTATQQPADPLPALPLVAPIQAAEDLAPGLKSTGAYRLYNHYGLPLNGACVNGLSEISGGSPIVLRDYQTFLQRAPEDVYSRLLNVHYTVTWRGGMGTDDGRRIPDRKLATDKYQNIEANTFLLDWPAPGPQPAWVVTNVVSVQDEDALYQRLNADDYDPSGEAVIYARDGSRVPGSAGGSAGLEGKATGYMKIAAHAEGPTLLVVSEAYHWNWTALVNGTEVRPLIVDGALLGVPIPAGNSTIELSYRPMDLYVGAGISAITLVITIVLRSLPVKPVPLGRGYKGTP